MSEIMVDEEVENILAEIRERVRGRELNPASTSLAEEGGEKSAGASLAPYEAPGTSANELLARIDAYLAVTSRSWDRLPPLMSNRSGGIARIELWVKRQIKRITHWFTWEQVNFNAAVHHSLQETVQALAAYQQALDALRTETEAQRVLLVQTQVTQREELQAERAQFNAQRAELETQRSAQVAARRTEMDARLAALAREMRDHVQHLQDEQRVCFKQLSLEATEAAVLADRARRQTDKLLEELRARIDESR